MPLDANTKVLVTGFGGQIYESVNNAVLTGTGFSTVQDTPFSITESCIASVNGSLLLPSNPFNTIGTGDFTVEWFQKIDSFPNDSGYWYVIYQTSSSGPIFFIRITHVDGKIHYLTNAASNPAIADTSSSLYGYGKASGYVHIAVVRASSVIKIFVNGSLAATAANLDTLNYGSVSIQTTCMVEGTRYANLRISNNARYTAAFTPPSVNFDAYRQVNQSSTLALATSFSTTQYKNKNINQNGSLTLTTSFSTIKYKNKNINQTGSLTLTVDPTALKNKANINGLTDGAGAINGTVTNKGVGVSATVRLYSTQGVGSLLATTTSDASGNFSFSSLVVGVPYFVVATHGTFADQSGKIVQAA